MSVNLSKLKNLLTPRGNSSDDDSNKIDVKPQIGFRVSYCQSAQRMRVKVIGARHLPTVYGTVRPVGYLVKVTAFPGKEKYETELVKESWPSFNQEFDFSLSKTDSSSISNTGVKFVSFTVYAILESFSGKQSATSSLKKRFLMFTGKKSELTRNKMRVSRRLSINNRRTIGAITYNLNSKTFNQKMKNDYVSTADIWRRLEPITSGIQHTMNEPKKGSLEVTMSYSISEDGTNDTIEVGLSKLRCSMQTMQQHEKLGGHLYIKIAAFEYDVRIAKLKSDKFEPTISLRIDPTTATLLAMVNRNNLDRVKIVIKLMCRNLLAKKHVLGTIEIDDGCDIWKQAMGTPCDTVTRMIDLE